MAFTKADLHKQARGPWGQKKENFPPGFYFMIVMLSGYEKRTTGDDITLLFCDRLNGLGYFGLSLSFSQIFRHGPQDKQEKNRAPSKKVGYSSSEKQEFSPRQQPIACCGAAWSALICLGERKKNKKAVPCMFEWQRMWEKLKVDG